MDGFFPQRQDEAENGCVWKSYRKEGQIVDKPKGKKNRAWIKAAAAAAFWLLLWQLAVMRMENTILVVSPVETVKALWELLKTAVFWKTVGTSFIKIALGFFLR